MKINLFIGVVLALTCSTASAQLIKVATETSPFAYVENGKVAGPATEIVESSLQRAGLTDYRVGVYPWARAYNMALQEPNVLIYLIARTPSRESQFKWVGEFMRIEYHLYKLRNRKDIAVSKLQDANAYSVGVVRDDVRHQYLQAQGFTKLVVSAQNDDNFKRLLNRQVQLVPMPERDAALLCEQANVDFSTLEKVYTLDALSTGIYMAYSKSTADETVIRTRAAFEKINAEGTVAALMHVKR